MPTYAGPGAAIHADAVVRLFGYNGAELIDQLVRADGMQTIPERKAPSIPIVRRLR